MATGKLLPLVQAAASGLLDRVVPVEATTPPMRPAPAFANEPQSRSMQGNPMQGNMPLLPNVFPQQDSNGFEPMKPGGGRFVGEAETGASWYKDPNLWNSLALGFNTMRLDPDQGLAAALQNRIKAAQDIKVSEGSKNKTVDALRQMGMNEGELALLSENPELLKIAATAMYKKKTGTDATAEMQTWQSYMDKLGTDDQRNEALLVKLGLKEKASGFSFQNLGTSIGVYKGGQQVAMLPIDLAGVQIQTAAGKEVGGARSNYSTIKGTVDVQKSILQTMINDPAVDDIFGTVAGATPSIRQSSVDAEARFGQIKGGAFLQSIQAMRGMGALSNAEGEAATRAATSLQLRMSPAAAKEEMRRMMVILEMGQSRALRDTMVDEDEVPEYMKDWAATYSNNGASVKIGGSTITEVK